MGSAASGLYPAVMDGHFVVPGEDATGHVSRRRRDLDANLSDGDRVREMDVLHPRVSLTSGGVSRSARGGGGGVGGGNIEVIVAAAFYFSLFLVLLRVIDCVFAVAACGNWSNKRIPLPFSFCHVLFSLSTLSLS